MIKTNERAIRPKPLPQFLASYQFAGPLDESGQQRQRLVGEILLLTPLRSSPERASNSKGPKPMQPGVGAWSSMVL